MHFDDEQVQRMLHGELDAAAAGARAHVADCDTCRRRCEEAQREEDLVFGLLRRLDHVAPTVDATVVAARARSRALSWMRWAASVLLALAVAGAAYAAPGSPVPALVHRLTGWLAGEQPAPAAPELAGIVVEPSARFTIVFASELSGSTATVALTAGGSIVVRRSSGVARFTTDIDRLTVEAGEETGHYEIELPRSAPWVEILAGERRLLLKDGARIVTTAAVGTAGRYSLRLGR
jgi:hypothetical protein